MNVSEKIKAAFREGYKEGYANGGLHADSYERGSIISEATRLRVEDDAWQDSETNARLLARM